MLFMFSLKLPESMVDLNSVYNIIIVR